jgi:hypothetical protein
VVYRIWNDWAGIDEYDDGLGTNPGSYTGTSPYMDSNDDAGSYVTYSESGGAYTRRQVLIFPTGIDVRSLMWQGGSYNADRLPGPPPVQETVSTSWRSEFVMRLRFAGLEPCQPPGDYTLNSFVYRTDGEWGGLGGFQPYLTGIWSTDWQTIYTGRSAIDATVDFYQEKADAGDFGLGIRWTPNPQTCGPESRPWSIDVSYVAMFIPDPGVLPPLRQSQRDDIRASQLTSRQRSIRQSAYL